MCLFCSTVVCLNIVSKNRVENKCTGRSSTNEVLFNKEIFPIRNHLFTKSWSEGNLGIGKVPDPDPQNDKFSFSQTVVFK
jgi:hypothetical protein